MLTVPDTKIINFITEKRYQPIRHFILLSSILVMLYFTQRLPEYPEITESNRLTYIAIIYVTLIGLFYFNIMFLVPSLFFRGKYIFYLVSIIAVALLAINIISYVIGYLLATDGITPIRRNYMRTYEAVMTLTTTTLVTTMIKLFQRWMQDSKKINELNSIRFAMELNELRNQINPHFLFNMLAGIRSLIRTNPEKANTVIMKLSEFLRYQLYENTEEKTLLNAEINFLSNFLDLENIRRDNFSTKLSLDVQTQELNKIFIPPNLFTVFIENAIKHSVNAHGKPSYVEVNIKVDDKGITFRCANSKDPQYSQTIKDSNSGIGLSNITRRLELLYGNRHSFTLSDTNTKFEITLTIPYELYPHR